MGWSGGDLRSLGPWLLCFTLAPGLAPADATEAAPQAELSPEDRALLELLELLEEWELLETWDPEEGLPIPVEEPDLAQETGP